MKLILEDANYDLENNISRNVLSQCHLELCDFAINYIFHCFICPIFCTYQDFFKHCFNNRCFQLLQNVA